jgi:MFS family permease
MPISVVEQKIRKDLRFNIIVNLADAMFFGAGFGFGSFGTIIPLFVSQLTTSAIIIGLIPAIHAVGWQLPQLFTANKVSQLRKYKPFVLLMTINERVPFLGFALVAWFMYSLDNKVALALVFLLLVWQGFGAGFTANAWQSFIAKIIPGEYRGTFFGAQAAVANILIFVSAIGAGYLLNGLDSPLDFTLTFSLAFAFMVFSWIALSLAREPEDLEKVIPDQFPPIWQGAGDLLRRDKNFSWFLVARTLSIFSTMGFSFYIIFGLRQFGIDTITAGYLTAALTFSSAIANVGMGWLGDRLGHRLMLIVGAMTISLSSGFAFLAQGVAWLYPAFILSGVASVAIWTIGMAMTVEFGTEAERPVYIGLSNTLVAPASILGPLLGGWVADAVSFQATFAISMVGGLVTAAVLWFMVKNPHQENTHAAFQAGH